MCRCRFSVNIGFLFFESLHGCRIASFVWWFLHLRDDHSPKREATLKRSNVYPRQIAIGGNIFIGNLVEQMTDSTCHNDRQNGCDHRKHDQSSGDADDLLPY